MERQIIKKVADNILSPIGRTSAENFTQAENGASALKLYKELWGVPEPFVASLFPEGTISRYMEEEEIKEPFPLTKFEKLCILSAAKAIRQAKLDAGMSNVIFVLSSTKGNIDILDAHKEEFPFERVLLGKSAGIISDYFKNPNPPVVASNACTSGVCAQLVAKRLLLSNKYDYAVVIGCDIQSKFIVSGFQAFKALSAEPCRPFDKERSGLNLGEAAATVILKRCDAADVTENEWVLQDGAIRNDANHISGPSRTGEGSYRCLRYVMRHCEPDDVAVINVHGTATPYNDEMEAIAIERAGLLPVPVNGYKGYYGHTMGAAGILETILTQMSVDKGVLLPTRGFATLGVSRDITVNDRLRATNKKSFIKLLSGFGGCNAALLYKKGGGLC